jgi:hypothetical protein
MSRAVTRAHGRAQQQEQRQAAAIAGFAAADFGPSIISNSNSPRPEEHKMTNLLPLLLPPAIMIVALQPLLPIIIITIILIMVLLHHPPPPPLLLPIIVPSNRLLRIRQSFNATGVRKKARSESTFDGHQRNNIRLLLYLYENKPELLVEELRRQLEDANAVPDYSEVERRYPEYARRGGKKNLDERKEEFRQKLLLDDRWQGLFHSRPLLMLSKMVW